MGRTWVDRRATVVVRAGAVWSDIDGTATDASIALTRVDSSAEVAMGPAPARRVDLAARARMARKTRT